MPATLMIWPIWKEEYPLTCARKSGRIKVAPYRPKPMMEPIKAPEAKFRSLNTVMSTSGVSFFVTRQKNTAAAARQTMPASTIARLCSQLSPGPSSTTHSSRPRNRAMAISAITSRRFRRFMFIFCRGISNQTAAMAIMPGTTLTRNSQCQLICCVIQPPSVGPIEGASVATMPIITCWVMDRPPGNSVKAAAIVVGTIAAPAKPWIARNAIRECRSHAVAHNILDNTNPPADMTNSLRMPNTRLRKPDSGMPTTSAIRYPV